MESAPSPSFPTTLWHVLQGGKDNSVARRQALADICERYWYPLYAFLRRRGVNSADAQDHIQEFLAGLLEKDFLATLDPRKGRFRSYLLTALQHHLANTRERNAAQKRGGRVRIVSLDAATAERRYLAEPAHELTPERLFEYRWARTVLRQAESRLAEEFRDAGQEAAFEALRGCLAGAHPNYAELAAKLGKSEGAARVQVHRLRQLFGDYVREEIGRTVASPEEVQEELRHLVDALRLPGAGMPEEGKTDPDGEGTTV